MCHGQTPVWMGFKSSTSHLREPEHAITDRILWTDPRCLGGKFLRIVHVVLFGEADRTREGKAK